MRMVIVLCLLYLTAAAPSRAGAGLVLPGGALDLARSEPLGRLAAPSTLGGAAIGTARADAAPLLGPSRCGLLPEGVKSCKTLAASA